MNKNFWTKFFGWFTRLMPVWVVLAGVIGFFNPEIYYPLKPYTNWAFSLTMLGIGAVLNFEDFLPIFKKPHLVLLGTLTQFGVMPAVPGAMASNVISYVAKADVAYSISLTTTSTLLSPVLTPLFVYIFVHRIVKVPFLSMVLSILQMVIIPLFLGAILKHFFKKSVEKIKEFLDLLLL